MREVHVRPYIREKRHQIKEVRRRPPSSPGSLGAIIDDVVAGRRSGYTWTRNFKFDIADAASMGRVYDRLGDRTMYVVGTTNRPLEEWVFAIEAGDKVPMPISSSQGVGVWRDPDTEQVYVDNIVLFFGPKVSENWALNYAMNRRQQSILKVDGPSRSFEFLEV